MSDLTKEISRRRTFAIISHPDAGKTTLTEKFLLYGGAINQAGSVKGKHTSKHAVSDWMGIEKERGISVTSSVMQFEYENYCINILDTPGHQDFSEDTYRTLMAADSAVMVIDGSKGVEAQTRKLFKVCVMRHIPIFTFINKMDREARDPFELLDELETEFGILTRCGLHCAPEAHKALGTYPAGTVRLSAGYFTTDDELIAAAAAVRQSLLIPSPPEVLRRLGELIVTAPFWRYTAMSLLRITLGCLTGIILGILAAAATHRFSLAEAVLAPAIRVVRATPVASFIILVLLWVQTGRVPAVISALVVLPVIWQSTTSGLRAVDPLLLEFAKAYRLRHLQVLRHIYLPAVLPSLSAGVLTAIGLSWKSGVAAEVLCLPKAAIGTQVYHSKLYLETPSLFAWTIVVVVLSMALEALARLLFRQGGKRA